MADVMQQLMAAAGTRLQNQERDPLQMAIAAGIVELLRRTGWREIKSYKDMPERGQHVMIWFKEGHNANIATCNIDAHDEKYFLLANSGIVRRARDEVSHWKPMGLDPYGKEMGDGDRY